MGRPNTFGRPLIVFIHCRAAFRIVAKKTGPDPILATYDPDGQLLEKTMATVDRLWAITEDLNILYRDNWTALARNEMRHYQTEMVRELRRIMLEERYSFRQTWTFPMSLLYALTLITTIGRALNNRPHHQVSFIDPALLLLLFMIIRSSITIST